MIVNVCLYLLLSGARKSGEPEQFDCKELVEAMWLRQKGVQVILYWFFAMKGESMTMASTYRNIPQ